MKSFIVLIFLIVFKTYLDDIFTVLISDLIVLLVFIKVLLNIFKIKIHLPAIHLPKFNKEFLNKSNLLKISGILGIILLMLFGFYLYKLHSLSVEANNLFANRCTKVNPYLISYKSAFLNFADYIQNPNKYSENDIKSFYNGYISGMRNYVKAEDNWLTVQKEFMNRWDSQTFQPWYIKKAEDLQWKMYKGYKDDAQYILDIGDQKVALSDPYSLDNKVRDQRNKAGNEYFDFYQKAIQINDWRKYIQYIPYPSVCNEKNTTIPETSGSIDWGEKQATPSSNFVPIDPYNII